MYIHMHTCVYSHIHMYVYTCVRTLVVTVGGKYHRLSDGVGTSGVREH